MTVIKIIDYIKNYWKYTSNIMKAKTGRFNYLLRNEDSPDGKQDTERIEYKQIINKLIREHQPNHSKDILAYDHPPRRTYSPIGQVLQLKNNPNSRQIKSIILNEQIAIKNPDARPKKDAYRIIKDGHIISDQDFNIFEEQSNSPPKVYYPAFKQYKPAQENEQPPAIKFYQIRKDPDGTQYKRSNMMKNNQPYMNQPVQSYQSLQKNQTTHSRQHRRTTPTKTTDLGQSRTTKNNKAYRADRSQERIYPHQQAANYQIGFLGRNDESQPMKQIAREKMRKRSCYDYVPEEMKAELRKQHEN